MEEFALLVDGEAVAAAYTPPRGLTRGAVLLVHGFNTDAREFGHLPERLATAGFASLGFDQRGFGRSGGQAGRTGIARAVADVRAAHSELQRRVPEAPIGLVGHSLGCAWVTYALADGLRAKAVVLAQGVNKMMQQFGAWQRPLFALLGPASMRRARRGQRPRTIWYPSPARNIFESKQHQRKWGRPDRWMRPMNLANFGDFQQIDVAALATARTEPALFVVSQEDRVVRRHHSLAVRDAWAGPTETFEHSGGHACFRDRDEEAVHAAVVAFLQQRLGG